MGVVFNRKPYMYILFSSLELLLPTELAYPGSDIYELESHETAHQPHLRNELCAIETALLARK